MNFSAGNSASNPDAAVLGDKLYIAWKELDSNNLGQIRVKEWNGTNWKFIDGNGTAGLNFNASNNAERPKLAVHNSRLYVTWHESEVAQEVKIASIGESMTEMSSVPSSYIKQIRVKEWDGKGSEVSNWSFVDGNEIAGINKNPDKPASNPILVEYNSHLINVWQEDSSTDTAVSQIRAAQAEEKTVSE